MAVLYLNVSDEPASSDAIVLFVGPDYDKRLQEAHQLIKEGYTNILIIPAYQRAYVMSDGDVTKELKPKPLRHVRKEYPKYYENTHIELLEARRLMEENSLKSAIMVSSPYHMRRIKIISSTVFDLKKYSICFIGSRYIEKGCFLSGFNWFNIEESFKEFFKIFGFCAYQSMSKA